VATLEIPCVAARRPPPRAHIGAVVITLATPAIAKRPARYADPLATEMSRGKVLLMSCFILIYCPFFQDISELIVLPYEVETPDDNYFAHLPTGGHTFVPVDEDHQPDSRGDAFACAPVVSADKTFELTQPGQAVIGVNCAKPPECPVFQAESKTLAGSVSRTSPITSRFGIRRSAATNKSALCNRTRSQQLNVVRERAPGVPACPRS